MLVEFLRDSKNRKIGVVVGIGPELVGWSLLKKCDTFNRDVGVKLAIERAGTVDPKTPDLPRSVKSLYEKMLDRCRRYYK